jgi:steroid delta-isomerase
MPTPEEVRAVVERYVDAQRRNDRQAFLSVFHPDALMIDPVGAPPHQGVDAIAALFDGPRQEAGELAFPDHTVIVCGDEAALVMTVEARTAAGGISFDVVDTIVVGDDARIVQLRAFWDLSTAKPL